MAKSDWEVLETNLGLVRIAKGKDAGDSFVMATMLTDKKVKINTYEDKDGNSVDVVNFNSQHGAFCSFRLETFKKLDIKIVDSWACVVAFVVERPELDELEKIKKTVKGSTLL